MSNSETYKKLYDILKVYNSKFNLTAIKNFEDYKIKHIEDSKLGLPFVKGRILDIGSGAGFPALVLKIERPELDITMVDSVRKKVDYLNAVIEELELKNIRAVHSRIEDIKEKESFDTVTARAVARLNVLAEYALPFVKTGGVFVSYKAENCEDEINEAKRAIILLGGKIERTESIALSEDTVRKIIVIRKIKPSPKVYPRGGNKPRNNPIV